MCGGGSVATGGGWGFFSTSAHRVAQFSSSSLPPLGEQGTPHVGASTVEAQNRVGAEIASAVLEALDGSPPPGNLVNKGVAPRFAPAKPKL